MKKLVFGVVACLILMSFQLKGDSSAEKQMQSFSLVKDSKPVADIMIFPSADPTTHFAAMELREALMQISGAPLFIRNHSDKRPCVVLAREGEWYFKKLRSVFASDLAKIRGGDGFVIKPHEGNIYIIGSSSKGVLNGVYSFLEKNTDIIWARPGEDGTHFTPAKNILATHVDYLEKPSFQYRGWGLCGYLPYQNYPTLLWMVRNRINYLGTSPNFFNEIEPIYNLYGILSFYGGHNLYRWIPNAGYFKEHPEYYAKINGERRPIAADTSLCFTNDELVDVFVEKIDGLLGSGTSLEFVSIKLHDNRAVCECEKCREPIKLPNGKILKPGDENFFCTQFFIFLNKVADKVVKKYPNAKLDTFSYFETTPAPAVKVHKNIWVMFAPAIRDDKHTLFEPSNSKWKERIENWNKVCSNLIMYEYYGTYIRFPRPLPDIVASDLKYIKSRGFRGITAETLPDTSSFGWGKRMHSTIWDASAMPFWVITKLYWDCDGDPEKLREQFLQRTYGPAAKAMGEYYKLIRDAWYAAPDNETFMSRDASLARRYIKDPGNQDKCAAALDKALKMADTEKRKNLILATKKQFDAWMKEITEKPVPEVNVPFVSEDISLSLTPASPEWEKAPVLEKMYKPGTETAPANKTEVRVLHDKNNLYINIVCFDKDMKNINCNDEYPKMDREVFPSEDDKLEIFFERNKKGTYSHLALGVSGGRYDAIGFDKDWNGDWKNSKVEKSDDRWQAMLTVPFKTLGYEGKAPEQLKFFIWREYHPMSKEKELSSWNGGTVHSIADFGEIILK